MCGDINPLEHSRICHKATKTQGAEPPFGFSAYDFGLYSKAVLTLLRRVPAAYGYGLTLTLKESNVYNYTKKSITTLKGSNKVFYI